MKRSLCQRVLDIYENNDTDICSIDLNIEKINQKILAVATEKCPEMTLKIIFKNQYNYNYTDDHVNSNPKANYYIYRIESESNIDIIWERLESYYKDEGFDIELYKDRYNRTINIAIIWGDIGDHSKSTDCAKSNIKIIDY